MSVFHKILTDRQYLFCENYCFGIDILNEMAIILNKSTGVKNGYSEPIPIDENKKTLHYRNSDNLFKYKIHNATGSYYKAYYSSSYKSAKANSMRLLKNPDIKKEIEYMELAIKIIGDRDKAFNLYISPNAPSRLKGDHEKKIAFWTYLRDLGYKKYGVNIF